MEPSGKLDFNQKPYIVIWETTQACDLACVHCRACAKPSRNPFELSTAEAKGLIDQIAEMKVPVFVLTGGDPLKRPDIYELVEYAHERGVHTSMLFRFDVMKQFQQPLQRCEHRGQNDGGEVVGRTGRVIRFGISDS